jgi:hypothetical protein
MLNFLKEFFLTEKNISPVSAFAKTPQIEDLDHALLEAVKNYRKSMFELAEKENFLNDSKAKESIEKIERTEQFIEQSGLGEWLAKFMTSLWVMRTEAAKSSESIPKLGKHGIQLTGGGSSEQGWDWITFFYGEHRYRVENRPRDWSAFEDDCDCRFGEGVLYCDDTEVFKIETKQYSNDEYFLWRYSCVLIFVKGVWIPEIVELATKFDIEDKQFIPKLMASVQAKRVMGFIDS